MPAERRRPRIAIATSTRFWLLDLARELAALGYEVSFYSVMPVARCERFGLDRRHCRSLFLPMAPLVLWQQKYGRIAPRAMERLFNGALNRLIASRLEPCDLFIGLSGAIVEAARHARRKYGAKIFIERGSTHIEAQAEILRAQGGEAPSDYVIARELAGYAMADRIVVPSSMSAASFARDPAAEAKLFVDPYGVDLSQFPRRARRHDGPPTVLMAGGWSYRKGVDFLVEAMERIPEAHLVHAGSMADAPFPKSDRMRSVGHVDQRELTRYYQEADVFVLPSREDGLGMVLLQALATGLPVVYSQGTGGRDLRFSPSIGERMDEVPVGDVDALEQAIRKRLAERARLPAISEKDRELLSWRRYAREYVSLIDETLGH